ncbi:hypothetical protein ScPMuIL_002368 [Solemya velum]
MDDEEDEQPTVLQNENPEFLSSGYGIVLGFLRQYGWFILLGVLVLLYIKSKLAPRIQKMRQNREQNYSESKKYDPDVAHKRLESMENARRRLQEQYDAQAAKFAEEQKKKEEIKRQEQIEDWERHQEGRGYRSKYKPKEETSQEFLKQQKKKKSSKPLKPSDYNPLTGESSGGMCFRPPRRGGGGGGG